LLDYLNASIKNNKNHIKQKDINYFVDTSKVVFGPILAFSQQHEFDPDQLLSLQTQ